MNMTQIIAAFETVATASVADAVDKVSQPLYLIRLKTKTDITEENPEGNKVIEFTATLEQLQDLVVKLADAAHSLNRLDLA